MLHTKLLMQRLVCVPWLLAASLALGWAGEAAAQADLELSVNPASVREDAGETDVEVTVQIADDTATDADTSVLLSVSTEGLNTRFRIELTTLRIPAGEKKATGILTFTPINDDIIDEDLLIDISGNAGSDKTVESATITLIDDDKDSQNIDLSVDIAELTRFDDATEITVTATLDGKVLNEDTSFSLVIGDHPDLTSDPNTDTDGDGDMDEADATKDNREALRDVDYTVTLATLTIPRRSVSGTATITITPKNQLPGTIRIESPDNDTDVAGIQIADDGLTLNSVDIALKKEVAATADAITLSQERVREDAGETVIELTVTLTEALVEDETVNLSVLSAGAVLPSGDTVTETPLRDVHYKLIFGESLTIPAGAAEGTTTFTITPKNDTDAVRRGTIYIQIRVGDVLATRTIVLVDDDSNSMNIWLTAVPAAISEGAGTTDVIVTGTLDGKVFDSDVVMLLTIDADINGDGEVNDDDEAAMRDVDYSATVRSLTIPADAASGTTTFTITPTDDRTVEADETIRLTVPDANNQITAQYADEGDVTLTVSTVDITLQDTGVGGAPSFATDAAVADQTYAVGTAIADLVLPEALGGDAPLIYSVSALPAGLAFDADTRTLAGTPTAATDGALAVTYTVTDSDDDTATLIFSMGIIYLTGQDFFRIFYITQGDVKMAKAPGKSEREGITILELFQMFPDEKAAIKWFEDERWGNTGIFCPRCGGCDKVNAVTSGSTMPYHCGDCRRYFSVRTGSLMERSKISLQKWAIAIYMVTTSLKSVSSMKLHRELGITQKSAWFMLHRIRQAFEQNGPLLDGPVEIDETYVGGKEANKHESKKQHAGRGPVGKAIVVGMKDRETNQVRADVIENAKREALHGFVGEHVQPEARKYTDELLAYNGLDNHEAVKHSISEWVRDQAHTNGIESFWALLKRGYYGTFHHVSPKHLHRYVNEFAGRHNIRDKDTIDQMRNLVAGMVGKRLMYAELIK